jgi:hypothetical protein
MAGLLDIFGTSGADTMGLLGMSPADIARNRDDAQAQALYALAGRLFQGGNTGASIAEGLQAGQKAYRGGMQETMQNQLQNVQLQDMIRKRQLEQQALAEQKRIQGVIQGAVTKPQEIYGEDMMGQQVGEGMTAGGFDLQRVVPQLMGTPEGRKTLTELVAAQKAMIGEPTKLGKNEQLIRINPITQKPEVIAGGKQAPQIAENPFDIFANDPDVPTALRATAQRYSKSYATGAIDDETADKRFAELSNRIQSSEQFKQAQAQTRALAEGSQSITRMLAEQKIDAAKNKPLPASLQKSEDEDLQAINSYKATQKELFAPINALTPDPVTKKPKLVLGPVQNLRYQAANLTGDSTEESRAYADLQSAVRNAVNLKVSAEKGVQTDKDVLRFADALIAASGKNDTKATLDALKKFNDSIATAQENTVKLIDQRRKSQGVAPLFGDTGRNVNVNY